MSWEGLAFLFLGILVGCTLTAIYLSMLIKKFKNDIKCNDCDADWWKKNQEPPF
jgi:hypothetical protein